MAATAAAALAPPLQHYIEMSKRKRQPRAIKEMTALQMRLEAYARDPQGTFETLAKKVAWTKLVSEHLYEYIVDNFSFSEYAKFMPTQLPEDIPAPLWKPALKAHVDSLEQAHPELKPMLWWLHMAADRTCSSFDVVPWLDEHYLVLVDRADARVNELIGTLWLEQMLRLVVPITAAPPVAQLTPERLLRDHGIVIAFPFERPPELGPIARAADDAAALIDDSEL